MSSINKYDFGWGEPFCVREALKHYYKRKTLNPINIDGMGYSPDNGNEELIKVTKNFIKETTGIDYKHVVITNGTTGAINIVLRVLAKEGRKTCYTHKYHFPYYPQIIKKNGYKHKTGLYRDHEEQLGHDNVVGLVDSPSNPEGDLLLYTDSKNNIIWDSVYHNQVFINTIPVIPDHRVNCGSYSKVFGLTGARVGWIATNSDEDFAKFSHENLYENCTMSFSSQNLILDIFKNVDLYNFMRSAKYRVNNNRELFDKICYLFDGQAVPENGMFFSAWATPYTIKLLDKLSIYSVQIDKSRKNQYLRFNLAQTNEITQKAIRCILKEDKI
jgi:aspartate/methionine/tyrosine aminotransferase